MSGNKKVLIITYYWPPSGGSGVQRWLKFTKYLPSFGWQPFVFTPENPSFDIRDESLLRDVHDEVEVIHFPIWEPYEIFFKISKMTGKKISAKPTELVNSSNSGVFQKISTWIRGNLLIPDPRRFWVRPSVKFLNDFLEDNKINTIITTGPPHSLHLIGLRLKMFNPKLKWIADFRDPWSEWGFLQSLNIGKMAHKMHRRLEKKVLSNADYITTATPSWVRQFKRLGGRNVELLTNGYDQDDFASLVYAKSTKFTIRHIGIVNERCDPRNFLLALNELAMTDDLFAESVSMEFIGTVHPRIHQFVDHHPILKCITRFVDNIPHKELLKQYGSSSLLLLVLTGYKNPEEYLPGKLFEYIATGLPLLALGPVDGDTAKILTELGRGTMLLGDDVNLIKQEIYQQYRQWKESSVPIVNRRGEEKFSRSAVTANLVDLLSK